MIPKEELYFRILDYIIKTHNGITDLNKVLRDLGLIEYIPHIGDIVSELEHKGFLKARRIYSDQYAITAYDLSAKYFVENYLNENLKNDKNHINSNLNQTMDKSDKVLDIFISHSSANQEVVKHFIELIVKAFKIDESKIRCTSVSGYKLPSGANVDSTLKTEIIDSRVFVGFITKESIESTYVLFELGARWVSDLGFMLINTDESLYGQLKAPLSNHHINNISERAGLYQILDELQKDLGYKPYSANAIESNVQHLTELISSLKNKKLDKEVVKSKTKVELTAFEMEILRSADGQSDGVIRIISTKDRTTIQCGTKVIIDSDSNKEIQQYKSAIEYLLEKEFLKAINNNGTRYEFTKKTYDFLELM